MRAQAETLGFVFAFTLILLSVGVVSVIGFSGLEDLRTGEATNNVERAFDTLDDDIEDIYRRGAPARVTGITVPQGTLSVGNTTTLNVSARDGSDNASFVSESQPLVFDNGEGTEIVYVHGAVLRSDRGRGVMLQEPEWLVNDSRVVAPLVTVEQAGDLGGVGGGTTTVRLSRVSTDINAFGADRGAVNVTVTLGTERAAAWERYLEDQGFSSTPDDDSGDDVVKYNRFTDAAYAPETVIEVELTR